ncbi:MAG TPA: hypothetical protein VF334_20930, partial [Polyangia bacterium]
MASTADVVTVTARGAARLRGGHPWVYAEDVARHDARGDVVRVVDGRGALLGTALWAAGARLPVRLLARDEVTFDAALVEARVRAADELRRRLLPSADAYRVVHAEADGLPGLVVDRYGSVLVAQILSAGAERWREAWGPMIAELTGATAVYERSDVEVRTLEGLRPRTGPLFGNAPDVVRIVE